MCKGPSTSTVNQQQNMPQYVQTAQQNLVDAAGRLTSPFLQNAPDSTVAGFSNDQLNAMDWSRILTNGTMASPATAVPNTSTIGSFLSPSTISATTPAFINGSAQGAAGQVTNISPIGTYSANAAPAQAASAGAATTVPLMSAGTAATSPILQAGPASIAPLLSAGPAAASQAASAGAASTAPLLSAGPAAASQAASAGAASTAPLLSAGTAAQSNAAAMNQNAGVINGGDVSQWMNPYTSNVLDPTIAEMRRQLGITKSGINAGNASSAAFGGSRGALQNAEADRNFGTQVAQTTGGLLNQGYNNAMVTALANAGRAQGNAQFNTGNQQQANLANTAATNAMSQFNTAAQQQANLANAASTNAMAQFNTGNQQQANLANASATNAMSQFNTGAQQQSNLANMAAQNAMSQFNTGNQQQANLANANSTNAMSQFNTATQQQAYLANAASQNAMAQFNTGTQQQANLANTAAQNAMAQFNTSTQNQDYLSNAASMNAMSQFNAGLQQNAGLFNSGQQADVNKFNANQYFNTDQARTNSLERMNEFNAGNQQQANLANAAAQNQVNALNAGYQQQGGMFNAQAINSANQASASQYNNMLEADANRGLTGAGLQDTFANDQQKRQLAALSGLYGSGQMQQQLAQQNLQQPFTMLDALRGSTPFSNFGGSSSSTSPNYSNPIASGLGLIAGANGLFGNSGLFPGALSGLSGMLGGGAASGVGALASGAAADAAWATPSFLSSIGIFSDERDKTDIQKLGRDDQTGLDMFAYRYKGDPKNTPKVVGPMAQQVEEKYPAAVREIGGHKIIQAGAVRGMMGV